jgi:type VI secretion system secreted protein VgrG
VFVRRLGARIVAAMGKIRVEAQGDELELLGQKSVALRSYEDWIHITGKKGVLINGGGSYVKLWPGGIECGTENEWNVHSKTQGFTGQRSFPVPDPRIPESDAPFSECYQLKNEVTSEVMARVPYCAETKEGRRYTGMSDDEGFTVPIYTKFPTEIVIRYGREATRYMRKLDKAKEVT